MHSKYRSEGKEKQSQNEKKKGWDAGLGVFYLAAPFGPTMPAAVLNRLIGELPSVIR
jgi:hypothetical protein